MVLEKEQDTITGNRKVEVKRIAVFAVLMGLCFWAFRPEILKIASSVTKSSESIHGLIIPIAIGLLLYCRRFAFLEKPMRGSVWGIAFMLMGLALHAGTIWPFEYGLAHDVAILPVLAGVVLTIFGWRTLRLSLPMFLLLLLMIPIGPRFYVSVVGRPEAYTISAAAKALNLLPGVKTAVKGVNLLYWKDQVPGIIGLGESYYGARLLISTVAIGTFVVFLRIRSPWRLVFIAVVTPLIIIICNYFRLLCAGVLVIYTDSEPSSTMPRNVSTILGLFAAYGLFLLACLVRINLFIDEDDDSVPGAEKLPECEKISTTGSHEHFVLSVRFLLAVLILLSAAIGLRPTMKALGKTYKKEPIAIRCPLKYFNISRLGSFRDGWESHPQSVSFDSLGTDEYVYLRLEKKHAPYKSFMSTRLVVSYYSNPREKVPHTPDVCYRQGGAIIKKLMTTTIDIPDLQQAGYAQEVEARLFLFRFKDHNMAVVYNFFVEGEFVTSRWKTRWNITIPGNRYTYYSLITAEANYPLGSEPDEAIKRAKTLFAEALPTLVAEYFPRKEQLKRH